MPAPDDWTTRCAAIRERMAAACRRAGRRPGDVRLVAATKTVPSERLRGLVAAGCRDLGENRIQEALPKIAALADLDPSWHFIGHLQRNKAKFVPGRFAWLHSLDTLDLARDLDRAIRSRGLPPLSCLVEVNVSGEPQKRGIAPEMLPAFLDGVARFESIVLRGLMTMSPAGASESFARHLFGTLRRLATRNGLKELSMGMSDDFETAVEEGATMVRIGRAIFGDRNKTP